MSGGGRQVGRVYSYQPEGCRFDSHPLHIDWELTLLSYVIPSKNKDPGNRSLGLMWYLLAPRHLDNN
ncbi:hypothetical protein L0F63_007334 [Massospora cicadina]|nr:hypothetical protein L0F63_007334 [Massospora cicadina]